MSSSIAGVITWPRSISIRATLFRDTLKRSANCACVNPIGSRIALNSFGVMYHYVADSNYTVKHRILRTDVLVALWIFENHLHLLITFAPGNILSTS